MDDELDLCFDVVTVIINNEQSLRYILVFVWIAGVLGNLVNVLVFSHKRMTSPVNRLLWWLSISDLFELVFCALYIRICGWCTYIDLFHPDYDTHSYLGAKIMHFSFILLQIFHTITVGLNITLAFWRYLAVAYPLEVKYQCDYHSVRLVVAGWYVLSFLLCLPVLFAFSVVEDYYVGDGTGVPMLSKTPKYSLQKTFDDDNYYYYIYCVALRVVPYIILIVISAMLIFAVIRMSRSRKQIVASATDAKQKQVNLITKMILVILLMFLITEIPMSVSGILWMLINLDIGHPESCENLLSRSQQLTLLINSSYNVFCYLILSTQYKETLQFLLSGNKCRGWVSRRPQKCEFSTVAQQDTELTDM